VLPRSRERQPESASSSVVVSPSVVPVPGGLTLGAVGRF